MPIFTSLIKPRQDGIDGSDLYYKIVVNHITEINKLDRLSRYKTVACTHVDFLDFSYLLIDTIDTLIQREIIKQSMAEEQAARALENNNLDEPDFDEDLPDESWHQGLADFKPDEPDLEEDNIPEGVSLHQTQELELSEGINLHELSANLRTARSLISSDNLLETARLIRNSVPTIKTISTKISQGNNLAALVPDNQVAAFSEAMEKFAKAFSAMSGKITDIANELNHSSAKHR